VKCLLSVQHNRVHHLFSPLFSAFDPSFFAPLYGTKFTKNTTVMEHKCEREEKNFEITLLLDDSK